MVLGFAVSARHCRTLTIFLRTAEASTKGRKGLVAMSLRNAWRSSGGMESKTHWGIERRGRSCDHERSSTFPLAIAVVAGEFNRNQRSYVLRRSMAETKTHARYFAYNIRMETNLPWLCRCIESSIERSATTIARQQRSVQFITPTRQRMVQYLTTPVKWIVPY